MQPLASRRTWRIRGVPHELDKTQLAHILRGHPDLRHSNQEALELDNNGNGAHVHTLAWDQLRAHEQVATVRFDNTPFLLEAKRPLTININTNLQDMALTEQGQRGQLTRAVIITIDEQFDGITTLVSPLTNKHQVDVLAVSGLGSHAFGSFVNKEDGNMWLANNIEKDMPNARVMIYGYKSGLQHNTSIVQFPDLAGPLLTAIHQLLGSDQKKPILLIGHSLGGLLVKQALIASSEDVLDMILGIFLFGAPNDGMDIRSLIPIVGNQPNRSLLESLNSMNSQVLRDQRERFPQVLRRINYKLFCFYETDLSPTAAQDPETGQYKMTGPSQCLVSQFSATSCLPAGYAHHSMAISRAHSELVKFAFHDTEYDKVLYFLARLQEMSPYHNIVANGYQRSQLAMLSQTREPAHFQANHLIEDGQVLQRGKRPAQDTHHSSKRPRASSPSIEGLPGQACDTIVSNTPSQKLMGDIKQLLINHLYFVKIDERLMHLTPAQGTTCRWFLTKKEYMTWHDPLQRSDHGGFLWIRGNPGTGKSTLMKFLFEAAKADANGDTSQILLSFFFLARGVVEEKTTTGLYRSLLHQIIEKAPDLRDSLDWMTIDGARIIERNGWQDEALKQTLMHAVSKLGNRSMTIFVDALDECNQNQAENMIFFFEELCLRATEAKVGLKICFSSRHYPTIVIQKGVELILEEMIGHADDIRQFIESRLRLGDSEQVESLRSEILEKSSGIFLWVVLVINILNSDKSMSIRKIREHLQTIPPRLNDLFDMILDRDQNNLQEMEICLKWILFAMRPLKAQELYFAIQFGCDQKCSGYWDQKDINMENMKIFVRSSSKGLAEITRNEASEVQFIHESVRDYLLGKYESEWSGFSGDFVGSSNDFLTKLCLAQIVAPISLLFDIPDPLPKASATRQLWDVMELKFPFLQYALNDVLRHANKAQQHGIDQQSFLAGFPLQIWVHLRNAFEKYDSTRYTKRVTLLYILAINNFADLIGIYSKRKACFEVENERYVAPALAALLNGSWEAVQAFSRAYAECEPPSSPIHKLCRQDGQNETGPDMSGLKMTSFRPQSISNYFFMLGVESIIFAFILSSHELDVNCKDGYDRTPLSWAAERGHEAVVELLLERGADANLMNDHGQPPIWFAADHGHEAIMEILQDNGADINLQNHKGQTPLWRAIGNDNRVAIELLLENCADVELKDTEGCTPLFMAVKMENSRVVELLLDWGATMHSNNGGMGHTPFSLAVDLGSEAIVGLLLQALADIQPFEEQERLPPGWWAVDGGKLIIATVPPEEEIDNQLGSPILLADATSSWNGITSGLLSDEAVGFPSQSSWTKLLWIVLGGADATLDLLPKAPARFQPLPSISMADEDTTAQFIIEKGADIHSKDITGRTLLSWAVTSADNFDTIELLLDKGAALESKDRYGQTPLMWAVKVHDNVCVIELLLERGANIESKDNDGRTPLRVALSAYRNDFVVEQLLRWGADVDAKDKHGRAPSLWLR